MIKQIVTIYLYIIYSIITCHDLNEEFLLCKQCGHEVALIKNIFYYKSPFATKTWNDSNLWPRTTIQQFKNSHGIQFDIITTKTADLTRLNETRSKQDTWFPSFHWTICLCPRCHSHLGWFFDHEDKSFFAIIVDKIFNEDYADSIIMQPKLRMF